MRVVLTLLMILSGQWAGVAATLPEVDLTPTLRPSAMIAAGAAGVPLRGTTVLADGAKIRLRVTTSAGTSHETTTQARQGSFTVHFPADFQPPALLVPAVLYVDATSAAGFGGPQAAVSQSEITVLVSVGGIRPELPLVFLDDFIDQAGKKDSASAQWPRNRALTNLFMRSRGAAFMRIQKPAFDLATPADWTWFQESATLYDFAHRDRDWSTPLGNRVAAGFWNAVWPRWFNPSNDHPWDGDASNKSRGNYRPYTFTNDPADLVALCRLNGPSSRALVDGVTANILASQHRTTDNFALREATGKQETYTAGAFRYGMFNSGEWLTEGKGWFYHPKFRDFTRGGVLNGRAAWALGESLRVAAPTAAEDLRTAIALVTKFCLRDALPLKYAYRTPSGKVIWSRTDGEHAYLLMGLLATYQVDPQMKLRMGLHGESLALRDVCADALDALAEIAGPDGSWSRYGNGNAVNIIALADGARHLKDHPRSAVWRTAAMRAADTWLALKFLPSEKRGDSPLFSSRESTGGAMTSAVTKNSKPHVSLYMNGHWLHALASLHALTGEVRYRERGERLLGYLCGDNGLRIRLINELGAVCNNVADTDGDGQDDQIFWNAYPESTAFVQIGLLHWLDGR